jgi:enoyl-CoA hydratase/carnithine racemase
MSIDANELKTLRFQKSDRVATIVKCRLPDNRMTRRMHEEMERCIDDVVADPEVRVVVLDAEGKDGGFHGGVDLDAVMRAPTHALVARELAARGHGLVESLLDLPIPVVGVVRGGARCGGLEVLYGCDFVIASKDAKFSQDEVHLGLIPGWGGTQRLPRLVGPRKAAQLILAGEHIDGVEAERIGLITKAVSKEEIDAELQRLIAALKRPSPTAMGLAKKALKVAREAPLSVGLAYEAEAFSLCMTSPQSREAWDAYFAKRAPKFAPDPQLTKDEHWK